MNWMIVVAGGRGERIGKGMNKIFLSLLGKPVIYWTLKTLEKLPSVQKIIITIGQADLKSLRRLVQESRFKKVGHFILTGETRQDSTLKALKWLKKERAENNDLVGVHNAVNPLVAPEEIRKVFAVARKFGAALLAMPARDTVKIGDEFNLVQQTPVRKFVWCAQTPQVGKFKLMLQAFERAQKDNFQGTDDTQLLERIGVKVKIVSCGPENFKITYPNDLVLAEEILKRREE